MSVFQIHTETTLLERKAFNVKLFGRPLPFLRQNAIRRQEPSAIRIRNEKNRRSKVQITSNKAVSSDINKNENKDKNSKKDECFCESRTFV